MTGTPPDNLLTQIEDIKGLDHISAWPLAPVWWIILGVTVAAAAGVFVWHWRRKAYECSWKGDAKRTLAELEERLAAAPARDVAGDLSSVLRRIAMQRFSRRACAGLEGQEWLAWLQKNDPRGFDWPTHGKLLTEIPYAPPNVAAQPDKIRTLIDAVKPWVA